MRWRRRSADGLDSGPDSVLTSPSLAGAARPAKRESPRCFFDSVNGVSDDTGELRRLRSRLQRAREARRAADGGPRGDSGSARAPGLGMALRIGAEMVAGVGVGAAIGHGLDRWLGTSPAMLILFFFLGAGAGALNTRRALAGAGFGTGGGSR